MNAFYEHHKNNIRFAYRCFDRILLHAAIQPFQQPERAVGFFDFYRQIYPVSRQLLRDISTQYHNWVKNRSQKWRVPIQEDPPGRRDDFVERYFQRAQPDQVVAIIKAREPATYMTAIGKYDRWHLEMKRRCVDQYNFYVQDSHWGRMFVRVCPYFPFSARVCLNQHYWLALRLQERGIRFRQCANAFLQCSDPKALQKLADSLTADDLITCAQKWLASFTPFFTAEEREHAGVQHRLFFAQVEFCDNLIFRRRAAVDALEQRLLDANRSIGQPNKLTLIFGRRITRRHAGKLQTVIEDMNLPNPVIRSHPQRFPQAIRPRSLPPPHRICNQQYLYRLRHRQGGGESSRIANAASRHHRPLSGSAARYLGNLCGPRGTSSTHPAHAATQRQTHSWSEARPASAAGPHALPGALLLPRRRRHLHYPRLISTDPAGTPGDTGRVQAWIPPL